MDEVITDEFIHYKSGFIAGKSSIIEAFKLGKILVLNETTDKEENDTWYNYGFEDGFNYFSKLINNNEEMGQINLKDIIKSSFTDKVVSINQTEDKEIPIGKFRL